MEMPTRTQLHALNQAAETIVAALKWRAELEGNDRFHSEVRGSVRMDRRYVEYVDLGNDVSICIQLDLIV